MGGPKICDCCMEVTSLLQSYDGKRVQLNEWTDVNISREEIETIILYMQSWTQRQCSCTFRDTKNFERFNWAIQILILVVVEILKNYHRKRRKVVETNVENEEKDNSNSKKEEGEEAKEVEDEIENSPKALWDIDDKDKLIHFVSKIFLSSFPLYVAYKISQMKPEDACTPQEIHTLGHFCEINEPEASPYLFRNVSLFCNANGMDFLSLCFTDQCPQSLTIQQANILVSLATNIKPWLNFQTLLKVYIPFRRIVLAYMCKLVELELKTASARNMSEFIWGAVKDPIDAHLNFDKDGLDLAFKYFLSTTLTMRLAGINQINNHINLFNELLNSEHILDSENLDQQLSKWLLDNQLIHHIFGPNLHVEVIKQSHTILNFLAMEGKITNDHIDIIWQAAQLKHCSKQVYDILSSLICNMEPMPVLHLHSLLKKLEPKDHTEQSLFLASSLIKFIWTNAMANLDNLAYNLPGGAAVLNNTSNNNPSSNLKRRHNNISNNNRIRSAIMEFSSSDNSGSGDGSHSEEDMMVNQLQIPRSSLIKEKNEKKAAGVDMNPISICHLFKTGEPNHHQHLNKGVVNIGEGDSSEEDSLSGGESGKTDDQENVQMSSSGYIETHSDSDADGERSGNEESPKKIKRKILKRKKGSPLVNEVKPMINTSSSSSSNSKKKDVNPLTEKSIEIKQVLKTNQDENENNENSGGEVENCASAEKKPKLEEKEPKSKNKKAAAAHAGKNGDIAENSEGSYSSRISTKSEKNMADFDGEESCEEELMDSLTQNQLVELAARSQGRLGVGPIFGPRRPFNRRKCFQNSQTLNFQIDNVCQPGQTLLWDLIQDDKIGQLADGLAAEAQKALTNLLCFSTDKMIRFKFIEGCIENLANNNSTVVSLRLLPKLFTSFQNLRAPGEIKKVTMWAETEKQMLHKFFCNLAKFKDSNSLFPYIVHVQARLQFLTIFFSTLTTPETFCLKLEYIDQLWDCLATDSRSSDELFIWLNDNVRMRDQHALSHETIRHIFIKKLPSLPPENLSMQALTLFQQLCNMARSSEQDVEAAAASIGYLWKIALCADSTDVSMTAIQYLNVYYISRQLEKEEEFVERIMSHLADAGGELSHCNLISEEAPLLRIQRALILLKSHLEIFRKRYAFHLRKWKLEGRGVGHHAQLIGEKGAIPIRVVIQPAGYHEKVTLELMSTDYVADLRAEVAKWWETIQGNIANERNNPTPVLCNHLLIEGPIRMITQGIELSAEYDEKLISEVPIKDLQLVYVSMGASRPQKKKDTMEYSSSLPPPPRDKLPLTLLLKPEYFEQLFSLMQSLSSIKATDRAGNCTGFPHTKSQVLSRRVWDILMLLPTNLEFRDAFSQIWKSESTNFQNLLNPASPQKLMYSLYIVEAMFKNSSIKFKEANGEEVKSEIWRKHFVEFGGLRHLFDIFASGALECIDDGGDWSEWKQDCLACLLKIICQLGIEDSDCIEEQFYDINEIPRVSRTPLAMARKKRKIDDDKITVPRLNETMLAMMDVERIMSRLNNILLACSHPRDPNHYKTGFWGRAQVVHYTMALLVNWSFSSSSVRRSLNSQKDFPIWLKRLVLEDPEPAVRREVCTGLYRLCLGVSLDGKTGISFSPELISHLLKCLPLSLSIRPQQHQKLEMHGQNLFEEGKEPYGPACRDFFWLLGRLLDSLDEDFIKESIEDPDNCVIDIDDLVRMISKSTIEREYLETRQNTFSDDGLVGLLTTTAVAMKHNPPFKTSKEGQEFLKQIFECLFALPSPQKRYFPKCKSQLSRSAAFDLLTEMARYSVENYYLLQNLLMEQHNPNSHAPYYWDYWPHEDGRSICGYVGLTNLGATCYMASCMQHLYMMPLARAEILAARLNPESKHESTLRELQRMFAYLLESERKSYNPRSFCKVYQMDHQPLNTGEQKDMAEFFIDLVSKLEEMTPELKKLVKNLFSGITSNNVVSLDCGHVSRTLEEFYTVRCQVADMRNLFESLDEVTVKDTLEGDNMYTCSQCGKKVRAEKRACFKKLPKILCFNTMRYTFNMITMMKEKVNTHFSFPLLLDMTGYVEKTLMAQQRQQEDKDKKQKVVNGEKSKTEEDENEIDNDTSESEEEQSLLYELIGVTVHTGTADGGHYYSFIRDRTTSKGDKWYLFNDSEVKSFDPSQIGSECFGGEMNTKTYDSVTDKFMDFSFEKTNSAYMLFYERCEPDLSSTIIGENSLVPSLPCLPGGSSNQKHPSLSISNQTLELNKELEDWIWNDNTHFLKDKNIFEHTYFNFLWQTCGYIPGTLMGQEDVTLMAAKLGVTFFLETFIHAKEKPTMVQWVELLTKQLSASEPASAWYLDHMAESDWWPVQILLKCPNQMVRQMFQRLCIHVIQQLRPRHSHLYLKIPDSQEGDHPNDVNLIEFGSFSCVTRFIKRLLSLLENGAKSHLKHLTEYFTFLHDFSKMGDEECLFLINMHAISVMVNFYLGKKEDQEHGSDEEEEEEEIVSIPAEKSKVASLEKMIALIAILVEKSRDETNALRLSTNDWNGLTGGGKNFPFILQQIRDGINFTSTRNLIFSLCRWNDKLAEDIVAAIFQSIQKHPDLCHPFYKILNLLAELVAGPVGMPSFTELILSRILDVADICPYPTLEWLGAQVPRNKIVHQWCINSMDTWVEHFLISHINQRVRNAAASLLVSLVPNPHFRQGYRSTKLYGGHCRDGLVSLTAEAQTILHEIYIRLLNLLKPAKHYTDVSTHGSSKLTAYFALLTYFTISKIEKLMFGTYFMDLWNLFHPKLSEPCISCHHNKQALLLFWHHVCVDCPENIQRIVQNPLVCKHIGFNYILADHEDDTTIIFNKTMLPAYYSILRMCCQTSRSFALHLSRHQNINWAFKNIAPYPTQYPSAVDELYKMMQIFITKTPETTENELNDITLFKRSTLQLFIQILDGRSSWSTLISVFKILLENLEDRFFVLCNNGIHIIFEAFHILHTMHHEATACHVTGDIVDLLNILTEILRSFRPKDFSGNSDVQLSRFISPSKEWPEVLRKLATLLNTYNSPDIRNSAMNCLIEFLYIMPLDCLRTLVPLLVHCHTSQDIQSVGMGPNYGPFFPRRSNSHGGIKPSMRPPRPMLQMAFPQICQETSRGIDDDYDRNLTEFYCQYHVFVDLLCRVAFMKEQVNQELVTLSAMVGYEGALLHFVHFPKLWIEVFNTPTLDRKYLNMLVNTSYFKDYLEQIIRHERISLTNIIIFNFVATFLTRVFDTLTNNDRILKILLQITLDLHSTVSKQPTDIEYFALKMLGDVKTLTLFYSSSINGNNTVRSPAPTVAQIKATIECLRVYLESLATRKQIEMSHASEIPTKKRKMEEILKRGDLNDVDIIGTSRSNSASTSSASTSQQKLNNSFNYEGMLHKNYLTQDLISVILGAIETLSRSIGKVEDENRSESSKNSNKKSTMNLNKKAEDSPSPKNENEESVSNNNKEKEDSNCNTTTGKKSDENELEMKENEPEREHEPEKKEKDTAETTPEDKAKIENTNEESTTKSN